ncbi:MAG: type III pantothenate kinase [Gammaproteobacteria bacterium]|nr:MAG: type III pantothenate kinase [Gammaproteobacteria bacterium]
MLLVDIGNARIKWALQDADYWKTGEPLQRQNRAFKDIARPAWKDLDTPGRVIVSNVAGEDYRKSVQTWIKRRWKVSTEFLPVAEQQCGVSNAYTVPQHLGADRWANLLAVHAHYKGPAVVIDCGTAITIDAIAADGAHLGGLIAPGMELMTSALTGQTAGIQIGEAGNQDISLLGRSTEAAVSGGVLYTAIALVERVFMDLQGELGDRTNLLLTGGDATRILPLLGSRPEYVPDLVLKGLAVYAEETAECVT